MDLGTVGAEEREKGAEFDGRRNPAAAETPDCEIGESFRDSETEKPSFGLRRVLGTVCFVSKLSFNLFIDNLGFLCSKFVELDLSFSFVDDY